MFIGTAFSFRSIDCVDLHVSDGWIMHLPVAAILLPEVFRPIRKHTTVSAHLPVLKCDLHPGSYTLCKRVYRAVIVRCINGDRCDKANIIDNIAEDTTYRLASVLVSVRI